MIRTVHLGAYGQIPGNEKENTQTWVSAFNGTKVGDVRFCGLNLYWLPKPKKSQFKGQAEKNQMAQSLNYWNQPGCLLGRWSGFLSVVCLAKRSYARYSSLKRMSRWSGCLGNKSLSQVFALQKGKKTVRVYTSVYLLLISR